jgi:hypothetical protein
MGLLHEKMADGCSFRQQKPSYFNALAGRLYVGAYIGQV